MAEKEINIRVNTKVDTSEAESLQELLENINKEDITVTVDVEDNELIEAEEELETLEEATNLPPIDLSVDGEEEVTTVTDSLEEIPDSIDVDVNLNGAESIDEVSSAAENASDALGRMADNADNANNSLGAIEGASLLGAAEGISSYASGAEGLAQSMNEASISVGQLATQTGIAEPQMVSLINTISNATFPNEEAMLYVKSLDQIGVSSQNLGKSATDLDKINDAFGLGATKVNSLGQELSVLGVDMNNVSTSFNALAYANANTVGGMDNYYTFLRKYDSQFRELGYDVDQTSIIIAAATQKYGGGRAALTGLSNALKEADGDTRKLEEALGIQAGTLDNASAVTGQYEGQLQSLANEEAEHKTILQQLGAVWEDLSLSMGNVMSPLLSVTGAIGQLGSAAVGINGINTLVKNIRELSMVSKISEGFSSFVTTLKSFEITSKLAAAGQWLLNVAMAANPVMIIIIAIVALIAVLTYLYFNNEQVRNAVNALGQTFMTVAGWIYNAVINLVQNVITGFQQLYNGVMTVINFIVNGVGQLPGRLAAIFNNVINRVVSFASNFINRLRNAAVNAVNAFISGISNLAGRVYNELAKTLNRVMQWGSQIINRLGSIAQQAWQAFIHGLGIGSPGYIQILTMKELDDTAYGMSRIAPEMIRNISKTAGSVVDAWGNPSFEYGVIGNSNGILDKNGELSIGDSGLIRVINELITAIKEHNTNGNGGDIILNLYDGDNEDRMRKIVEAVRRELFWNNKTADYTI